MAHVAEEKKLVLTYVDKERRCFDVVEVSEDVEEVNVLTCYVSSIREDKVNTSTATPNTSTSQEHLNILDVQFYTSTVLGVLLEDAPSHNSTAHFLFVPLAMLKSHSTSFSEKSGVPSPVLPQGSIPQGTPITQNSLDLATVFDTKDFFLLDSLVGAKFAASGVRNVLVVLAETRRKIRLFEIDTEGEEEEEGGDEEMLADRSMNVSQ